MIIETALLFMLTDLRFHANLVTTRLDSKCVRVNERHVFEDRLETAREIELELRKNGLHRDKTILALLVNIWHENRWNPKLNADGLFQMTPTGMGRGLTVFQKQDIKTNVKIMVNTERFQTWWDYSKNPNISTAQSSFRFAEYVLRPQERYRYQRKATAEKWSKFLSPKPFKNK